MPKATSAPVYTRRGTPAGYRRVWNGDYRSCYFNDFREASSKLNTAILRVQDAERKCTQYGQLAYDSGRYKDDLKDRLRVMSLQLIRNRKLRDANCQALAWRINYVNKLQNVVNAKEQQARWRVRNAATWVCPVHGHPHVPVCTRAGSHRGG